MESLRNKDFNGFCDRIEDNSLDESAIHLWGSVDIPQNTLAPVAERIVNPEATQYAWLEDVKRNIARYRKLHENLADEKSRRTLESIFRYRITLNPEELTESLPGPHLKYFDWSLLTKPEQAVYVDGGAHTGGSVENFISRYGYDYSSIVAFEPFEKSFLDLQSRYRNNERVRTIPKALWDSVQNLVILGKDQRAKVLDIPLSEQERHAATVIETTTLDMELEEPPSLIKMDMEGAEVAAIRGAVRCIKSGLPRLAICAYHLIEDLHTLPDEITNIDDSYQFKLRNYKKTGSAEIVLYGESIK